MQLLSSDVSTVLPDVGHRLKKELRIQSEQCIDCKLGSQGGEFLRKYGTPKHIADTHDPASPINRKMPFECCLCGFCAAVCPVKINPSAMFLEMRREVVTMGLLNFSAYDRILKYERRETSRRYS